MYRSYQSGRSGSERSESYQDEWQSPLKHDAGTFDAADALLLGTSRASLQRVTRLALTGMDDSERSSAIRTSRAPPRRATGLIWLLVRFAELRSVLACASKKKLPLRQAVQKHTDKQSYDLRKKGRTSRDIGCG